MVFDLLYLCDIAFEVAFRESGSSNYFRRTELSNKALGSCLRVDLLMLVSGESRDQIEVCLGTENKLRG